jgi:hypothetical protein
MNRFKEDPNYEKDEPIQRMIESVRGARLRLSGDTTSLDRITTIRLRHLLIWITQFFGPMVVGLRWELIQIMKRLWITLLGIQ